MTTKEQHAELTYRQIVDQPNADVSLRLALLAFEHIRSDLRGKSKTILESENVTQMDKLYARWFDDVAGSVNRFMNSLQSESEEKSY